MKKDYIEKIDPNAERRSLSGKVELRELGEGETTPTISGIACVFDTTTDMGWYIEKISRDAFSGADMTDVVALFNHEDEELLSRTTGNAEDLVLTVSQAGLEYQFRAKNECSKEVAQNIGLGFIKGSSFAFTCSGEEWEFDVKQADGTTKDIRTITKIGKVYDVSPVTWPAYNQTSVALRSRDLSKPKPTISGTEIRNKTRLEIIKNRK
jgi:HK97 family phage prohead protease